MFDGKKIDDQAGVIAYLESSAEKCNSQIRVCSEGHLSGNYQYSSCSESVKKKSACLFDGKNISDSETVSAFKSSSVDFGQSCEQELRKCEDGVLSGSFQYSSCSTALPKSCLFNTLTVSHGDVVKAYSQSNVQFGEACTSEDRACTNGNLSGSFKYSSCVKGQPKSCLFAGQTIPSGGSVNAFRASSVKFDEKCALEKRSCTDGMLSGTFEFESCAIGTPKACLFNGKTILHSNSVSAFKEPLVEHDQSCSKEERLCTNGQLSGAYTNDSCIKKAPPSCAIDGVALLPKSCGLPTQLHADIDFEPESASEVVGSRINKDGSLVDYHDYGYSPLFKNWRRFPLHTFGGGLRPFIFNHLGTNVLRMQVNPTPNNPLTPDQPFDRDRAEYVVKTDIRAGHTYYMQFRVYIPYDAKKFPLPSNWFLIMQARQNGSNDESPPLSISYASRDGGSLWVSVLGEKGGKRILKIPMDGKFNQWRTVSLYFKMGPNGEVATFDDGQWSPIKKHYINWDKTCEKCRPDYTLKFGIYRGPQNNGMFINYDDFKLYEVLPK